MLVVADHRHPLMSVAIFAMGGQGKKARELRHPREDEAGRDHARQLQARQGRLPPEPPVAHRPEVRDRHHRLLAAPVNYLVPGPAGRDYLLTSSGEDGTPGTEDGIDPVRIAEQERQAAERRSRHRTNARRRPPCTTRGMTILSPGRPRGVHVGLVAASVAGAVNASNTMEIRNRMTVAAYELGNRLVLTWLDDDTRMPAAAAPLDYGDHRFFWDKKLEPSASARTRSSANCSDSTGSTGSAC